MKKKDKQRKEIPAVSVVKNGILDKFLHFCLSYPSFSIVF